MSTMQKRPAYRVVSSTTMASPIIDYPGQHDFVVVTSDGVRFNLSRTVLAATSGFFADMFDVGDPSSSTQSSEEQTVNASEDHVILDSLFAISYSHPEKPKPSIVTFTEIAELIRVAEKYSMRHALDYLSSHLTLPRIQGTIVIQPFTATHPLATLSLSLTQGFSLPARLALKEVVNATNSIWNAASDDATLDGFTLDFRTLKKIHRMRNSRVAAYKRFIENLQPAPQNSSHVAQPASGFGQPAGQPAGLFGQPASQSVGAFGAFGQSRPVTNLPNQQQSECATCVQNWKADLLKKFEEVPNLAAFGVVFYKGWTCGKCGQSLMSHNRVAFERFITSQTAEESTLPELG